MIADVLSHRRLLEDRGAGWAHALLFYGFVGLFIGTCLVFVHDRIVAFLIGPTYLVFSFLLEWAGLAFLAGVALGGVAPPRRQPAAARAERRRIRHPGAPRRDRADRLSAGGGPHRGDRPAVRGLVVRRMDALRALCAPPVWRATPLHRALWGIHAALVWVFFGLIGATVLRHMVAAPVQLALRQLRAPGQLAPP